MSPRTTTFWYAVLALAVVRSAVAVPMVTINAPEPTGQQQDVNTLAPASSQDQKQQDKPLEPTDLLPVVPGSDATTASTTVTEPSQQTTGQAADASGSPAAVEATNPEVTDGGFQQTGSADEQPTSTVAATDSPSTMAGTDSPSTVATETSRPTTGQNAKPYYSGGVHTINFGPGVPALPFFLEFFQPFQPYPQPIRPFKQQPYGAPIDPFDPFAGPTASRPSPFHQLVEAYTNEFRDMLETLEKMPTMPQTIDAGSVKDGSGKPVAKTTTKTEVINGHVVQINETTYSDGDENHKSFYHFKEIQVLPDTASKKIATEKLTSVSKDDSETQKVETNEIKREPSVEGAVDDPPQQNSLKKDTAEPISLDEHFQTAAATYYSPYAPSYGPESADLMHFGRPMMANHFGPPPPPHANLGHPPPPPSPANFFGRPSPPQINYFGHPPPPPPPPYYNQQQQLPPNYNQQQQLPPNYNQQQQLNYNQQSNYNQQRPQQQQQQPNYNQQRPQQQQQQQQQQQPNYNQQRPQQQQQQQQQQPNYNQQQPQPISLHSDTLVNELVAAQQQAAGVTATLPPDVELIDVNGKPQRGQQFYYNNNNYQHRGYDKFPGRKY